MKKISKASLAQYACSSDKDKANLALNALEYRKLLSEAKTAIEHLMACNEISQIADIRGQEVIDEINNMIKS